MNKHLQQVIHRTNEWCNVTGLKTSNARQSSVFPWLGKYGPWPIGFDHTSIFYSSLHRIHILVTEPYHSAIDAFIGVKMAAGDHSFDYVFGREGRGLWFPGECYTLLIAKHGSKEFLKKCASVLPT